MDPLRGLRLGAVPYLNAAPLVHGLDVKTAVPSTLARWLDEGACDLAAALSIGATLDRPDWRVLPSLGVAADGPVRTVMILHEAPLETVRGLVLDPASRSSNLLARWIVQRLSGHAPEIVPQGPARVVIGDPAFAHDPAEGTDMAQAWKDLTGLPFVFAGWVAGPALAREPARLREIDQFLSERIRDVDRDVEEIVVSQTVVPVGTARHYLTHNIRFSLDERFRAGADLFAAEMALLGEGAGAVPWAR
jgi:predicted solute-binding protein